MYTYIDVGEVGSYTFTVENVREHVMYGLHGLSPLTFHGAQDARQVPTN
jgi:hypothetical protein